MTQINFNDLFNTLKNGVVGLANTTIKDYTTQAIEDGQNILDSMKDKLQSWATQLANGEITSDELEFQLGSEDALLKMIALKQAGIAEIELDQFKSGLIDLITKTLSTVI